MLLRKSWAFDFSDPTTWSGDPPDEHQHRIYLTPDLETFALVDAEDFSWFSRWSWHPKKSRLSSNVYACRCITRRTKDGRTDASSYLHVEILKRAGVTPPSPLHSIGDHRNGLTLDCRKTNLRWLTPAQNARNVKGNHAHDFQD